MPALEAIIEYGALPAQEFPLDEPDILVSSLDADPKRDEKLYKGPSKVTQAARYQNPTIEFDFKGLILNYAGLADQHPGTTVDSIANFADDIHGFSNDNGLMIYKDPKRSGNNEDPAMTAFKIFQLPFLTA